MMLPWPTVVNFQCLYQLVIAKKSWCGCMKKEAPLQLCRMRRWVCLEIGQERTLSRQKQQIPNMCLSVLSDYFPRCTRKKKKTSLNKTVDNHLVCLFTLKTSKTRHFCIMHWKVLVFGICRNTFYITYIFHMSTVFLTALTCFSIFTFDSYATQNQLSICTRFLKSVHLTSMF